MEQATISVGFLLFHGFPMACLTSMIEPLRAANEISNTRTFAWRLLSEEGGTLTASAHVDFETDALGAPGEDYIFVLSSPTATFRTSATPAHLRAFHRHGGTLGAVSGGVFPLVKAQVVGAHRIAVHWCYRAAFDAQFPDLAASDQVLEIADTVMTAAGAAAAFDLALHLIEDRLGPAIAAEVACWFQHPMMRRGDVVQAIPVAEAATALPPLAARAVALMTADMANPITVGQAAARLGISPRHMERAFKAATGLGPTRYFRKIRMEAARQIVLYTNDPIAKIAGQVGYGSTQTFAKHYEDAFGMTPAQDRKRINLYRVKGNLPVPSL